VAASPVVFDIKIAFGILSIPRLVGSKLNLNLRRRSSGILVWMDVGFRMDGCH
jgi:hypothetical protein